MVLPYILSGVSAAATTYLIHAYVPIRSSRQGTISRPSCFCDFEYANQCLWLMSSLSLHSQSKALNDFKQSLAFFRVLVQYSSLHAIVKLIMYGVTRLTYGFALKTSICSGVNVFQFTIVNLLNWLFSINLFSVHVLVS